MTTMTAEMSKWRATSKRPVEGAPGLYELLCSVTCLDGRSIPRGALVRPLSGGHDNISGADTVTLTRQQ